MPDSVTRDLGDILGHGWMTGAALAALPESLQGLVIPRDGWMPGSWSDYLCVKAERCQALHPDLAERYWRAAELLRKAARCY